MNAPEPLFTSLAYLVRWDGVFEAVVVIAVSAVLVRLLRGSTARVGSRAGQNRPAVHRVSSLLQLALVVAAAVLASSLALRWDRGAAALAAIAVALGLGLGLRDLGASLVASFWILLDRPFQVGDRVRFGADSGEVVVIGVRSVRLRTAADEIVTIPSHRFLGDAVQCETPGTVHAAVTLELAVGVDQDVARARQIVHEAALTSRFLYPHRPVEVLVEQVLEGGLSAARLRLRAHVLDPRHRESFASDVHQRALAAFRESGILPPAVLHRAV
jgi:small-conductance mechanosensitive channel